ncbi:MAG: dCMP deaminase [Rhizobiaceae bacterium]|nr:dCMP deaminase [Rhizobiaceae bacterium]
MLTKPNHWDIRFFELCDLVASWSEDRGRKVGAVIVGQSNEIRSTGYNGFPRKVNPIPKERHNRANGEKYFWFEHAERNAIYNAARHGSIIENCRIYCSMFPCADCVRAIIQSGIIELNTFSAPLDDDTFKRSFEVSRIMLNEAGIKVRLFNQNNPHFNKLKLKSM